MNTNDIINILISISGIILAICAVYISHVAGRKRLNLSYHLDSFNGDFAGLHLFIKIENNTDAYVQLAEVGMLKKHGCIVVFDNLMHPVLMASRSVFLFGPVMLGTSSEILKQSKSIFKLYTKDRNGRMSTVQFNRTSLFSEICHTGKQFKDILKSNRLKKTAQEI